MTLYALGLETKEKILDDMQKAASGEMVDTTASSHSYEEILNIKFKVILSSDMYQKTSDGSYENLSETDAGLSYLYDNSDIELKITGIIRPNEGTMSSAASSGGLGYTEKLADLIIEKTSENELLKEQLGNEETDVLTGLPFNSENMTSEKKISLVKEYFSTLNDEKKAEIYVEIQSIPSQEYIDSAVNGILSQTTEEELKEMIKQAITQQMSLDEERINEYVDNMSEETVNEHVTEIITESVTRQYAENVASQFSSLPPAAIAAMFDEREFSDDDYERFFSLFSDDIVSDSTYNENLEKLGYVDKENPSSVAIYSETFENKDKISELIEEYNNGVENQDDKITYTDYIALLMSSITTIIDAISYVLIAFVTISLVVSSIMIGIITYISVLERTKEIGILRSIGASKRDISRVFNAETLIVGFVAGIIGIAITLLFIAVINIILHSLTGIETLNAVLPVAAAVILVAISMFLTFIAGLIPSRIAAKKDPVIALRTE